MADPSRNQTVETQRDVKTRENETPKQWETMKQRKIPVYVRTHSDSFSEPLAIPDTKIRSKKPKRKPNRGVEDIEEVSKTRPQRDHLATPTYVRAHSDSFCDVASVPDVSRSTGDVDERHSPLCGCCQRIKSNVEPRESWILLLLSIMPTNMLVGMNLIVFGLYYVEYVDYFQTSVFSVGMIMAIKTGVVSVVGIFASTFMKRFRARTVSMVGASCIVAAVMANGFAPNIYVLYLSQGVLEGVGVSIIVLNSSVLIQQHFNKNRAIGGGLGMLGYSLGHFAGPSVVDFLIRKYGWRGSCLILSALYANMIAISATYWSPAERMRPGNQTTVTEEDADHHEDSGVETEDNDSCALDKRDGDGDSEDSESEDEEQSESACKTICKDIFNFRYFKEVKFSLICVAAAMARYNIKTFLEHIPNKVVSLGMTRSDGAFVVSIFSMTAIVMRILTTFLANLKNVNRIIYYALGVFVGAVASLMTMLHNFKGQSIAAVLHGIHTGCTNTIQTVVIVDLMGVDKLAKSIALFNLAISAWSMLATPFGGYLYDVTQNYDIPFIVSGSLSFLASVLTLAIGIVYERTRRQKRKMARK